MSSNCAFSAFSAPTIVAYAIPRRSLSPPRLSVVEAGIEPSVGSRGDSYDNALAESVIGLFKTEVIHRRGPWRGFDDVAFATLEWVWWFNHQRLMEPLGYLPPAEFEEQLHRTTKTPATHVAEAVLT